MTIAQVAVRIVPTILSLKHRPLPWNPKLPNLFTIPLPRASKRPYGQRSIRSVRNPGDAAHAKVRLLPGASRR